MSDERKIPKVPDGDPIAELAKTKAYWMKKFCQMDTEEFNAFSDDVCKKCRFVHGDFETGRKSKATSCDYFFKLGQLRMNSPMQCISDGHFSPKRGVEPFPKDYITSEAHSWCSSTDCGNEECPYNLCHVRFRWFHHDVVLRKWPGCGWVKAERSRKREHFEET